MSLLTQDYINKKLIELNGELLKKPYKNKWSKNNPTLGYCYIISEAIYHYYNCEFNAYCINYGEEFGTHWFLKDKNNNIIIDFTKDQFPFEVDYDLGKRKAFFKGGIKTDKGYISKRGYEMASHLGLVDDKNKK